MPALYALPRLYAEQQPQKNISGCNKMIEVVPNWHPVFVHFTVALLSIATVFYLLTLSLSRNRWKDQWLAVANWNLWLGSAFAIATAIAGWNAYNSVLHDTPSHAAMTDHRNWAFATLAIFIPLGVWSLWRARKNKTTGILFLVFILAGTGVLMSTAWRGGEIVYRYGLGVMSMPKVGIHVRGENAPAHRDADNSHQHLHD